MLFSSTVFLFLFLPITLGIYFLLQDKLRNFFLLIVSLFFYAWGEHELVLLMMTSISMNYIVGILISNSNEKGNHSLSKIYLAIGTSLNLSVLIYYKYFHFIISNLSSIGFESNVDTSGIILPIGISFFTFQSISYLIDVHRGDVKGQNNIINLGMYISLFPQLIAGPIVRYSDINKEIDERTYSKESFNSGISRFIIGLSKKVIIANNVGLIADKVFEISPNDLSSSLTWIGIICYSLQIYYDFSGYSDMAIGLGRMFGFNFKENFNHPYISISIQDFWRRWHISLSTWFRDYLYIPLGGNRKGNIRTYINLLIVFFITGLWHGASWNFVIWGLFHGLFLMIERLGLLSKIPSKLSIIKRIYTLLIILIGWVIFRSENMEYAIQFISRMFSFSSGNNATPYLYINTFVVLNIVIGIVFATPLRGYLGEKIGSISMLFAYRSYLKHAIYIILFIASIFELAQTTYNPFIYFRF